MINDISALRSDPVMAEVAADYGVPIILMHMKGTPKTMQISPVYELDHRPIGSGEVGPITRRIRARYFDAVRGRDPKYRHWLTPIPPLG